VPFILFGLFIALRSLPAPFDFKYTLFDMKSLGFKDSLSIDIVACVILVWTAYTIFLDSIVASLLFGSFLVISNLADATVNAIDDKRRCLWVAGGIEILSWGIQIVVGHNYFENRKPALFDNVFQMIISPFFLVLEFLFLFGYRPRLYAEIETEIERTLDAWHEKKRQRASKPSPAKAAPKPAQSEEHRETVHTPLRSSGSVRKVASRTVSKSPARNSSAANTPTRTVTKRDLNLEASTHLNGKYWQ